MFLVVFLNQRKLLWSIVEWYLRVNSVWYEHGKNINANYIYIHIIEE